MDAVVDRYFPVLDAIETSSRRSRSSIFTDARRARTSRRSTTLKQKLTTLKHAVEPLLEYARQALRRPRAAGVRAARSEYFRDVYDHLVRLNQSIDAPRDMVTTAISVNLAMITLGESEVTKRLAAYAALVAVPTMIAGVYGMNFEHMPELKWTYGYPLVDRASWS